MERRRRAQPAAAALAEPMVRAVRRRDKPRERWLLTRKTWKYMADAGRRLIPDGAQNRPEDLPRLEAYFQDVCAREPRFLLWRKSSYPGALPPRATRRKKRQRGGSVRARSPDEALPAARPTDLYLPHVSGGRLDIAKLRRDFFATPSPALAAAAPPPPTPEPEPEPDEETTLVELLRKYLKLEEDEGPSRLCGSAELVKSLRRYLARQYDRVPADGVTGAGGAAGSAGGSAGSAPAGQRSLLDTLARYYGRSPNRDHIVQELLTDRSLLKRLYHDLRKTKPYRGGRSGGAGGGYGGLGSVRGSALRGGPGGGAVGAGGPVGVGRGRGEDVRSPPMSPPPLIEVKGESLEDKYLECGTQTSPIPECVLAECERAYRARQEADTAPGSPTSPPPERRPARRRSSVDHDDVSQSVSDTIKRYLRMARKKSVDADKADRFKRINYDKNLRNIKAKAPGEVDDDGLNKGCQTEEGWILTYRELKFASFASTPTSPPLSPTSPTQSHSFLSSLLGRSAPAAGSPAPAAPVGSAPAGGMQKSRSSSSVVQSVSKRLWRTRSRSSSRVSATWTPQGSCCWLDGLGRCVRLTDTSLLTLSEVERRALQQAALARLQQLSLTANIKIPEENASSSSSKPKRRAYLLKRKAITTSFFDPRGGKDADKDKDVSGSGSVFGVPLAQCVEAERALRRQQHGGSRASLASLGAIERAERAEDSESCDSSDWGWAGLEEAGGGGPRVPALVSACLAHLRRHGLRTVGLFRVSASKKRVRQLREECERGQEAALDAAVCPHDVANLLKEFLRDLPDPLLCRDLYQAFLQTQKIRNRRLQWEALRLVVQLLPAAHRDTLSALLSFLSQLAAHSEDDHQPGNKMDSANLATVIAPNILHRNKPNENANTEQLSERTDVINVVRQLIERQTELWTLPAELLHDAYIHLAHTAPAHLDSLLLRRHECASERLSTGGTAAPPGGAGGAGSAGCAGGGGGEEGAGGRRVWSREEFLHGTAATGGPDKDVPTRRNEKTYSRTRRTRDNASDTSSVSSAMTIVTRVRSSAEEYGSSGVVCSPPSDLLSPSHTSPSPSPAVTSPASLASHTSAPSAPSATESNDSGSEYNETLGGSDDDSCVITASLHIPAAFPRAPPSPPSPPSAPAPPPRRRSTSGSESEAKRDSAVGSSSPATASTASSPPASPPPPAALRVTLTSTGERHRTSDIDKIMALSRERNTSDARAHVLRHHDEPPRARAALTSPLSSRQREEQTLLTSRHREEQSILTSRHREEQISRQKDSKEGMLYKRGELISSARPPP